MIGRLFLGTLLLLSSCRPYTYRSQFLPTRCTELPETAQKFTQYGELDEDSWWTLFNDPQLSALIEQALCANPDMKIAEARIQLACQEAKLAGSTLLPHLFGFGNYMRNKVSEFGSQIPGELGVFNEATLSINATYELDLWKKNRSKYYAELDRVQAALAEKSWTQLLLASSVASTYFNWQNHRTRLALAKERLVAREGVHNLLAEQFERGVISEFRLYESDSAVAMIQDEIELLRQMIEIDKHQLAALVGGKLCIDRPPHVSLCRAPPMPCALPLDLIVRRPDIVANLWRIEAGCYEVKVAKARFFPRIDLLSWFGSQSFKLSKFFTENAVIALGEATGMLPIFTAGKLKADLGVARESLEIAVEEYNQSILMAVQEIGDAVSIFRASVTREQLIERSLADARNLYSLTKQRYEGGIASLLPVLNAQTNVLMQQDLQAQIRLARLQSAVAMIRAVGGGYDAREGEGELPPP